MTALELSRKLLDLVADYGNIEVAIQNQKSVDLNSKEEIKSIDIQDVVLDTDKIIILKGEKK